MPGCIALVDLMLAISDHVFCVIAYTLKCSNRHQNQISMLNVGKVIKFLQIT